MAPILTTRRLRLRGLEACDAQDLLARYSDPEVMRYWIPPPWTALSQADDAIREAQEDYATARSLHLLIGQRDSGARVGSCALDAFTPDRRTATLGYLLARPHWGRGYAGEALEALLAHRFEQLGLTTVRAEVDPLNHSSYNLLARLGFLRHSAVPARWIIGEGVRDVDVLELRPCGKNTTFWPDLVRPDRVVA